MLSQLKPDRVEVPYEVLWKAVPDVPTEASAKQVMLACLLFDNPQGVAEFRAHAEMARRAALYPILGRLKFEGWSLRDILRVQRWLTPRNEPIYYPSQERLSRVD